MNVPELLVTMVKKYEGFHRVVKRTPFVTAVPYLCPAGYWTIGYGQLCQRDHPPITLAQGEKMLMNALPQYMNHAVRLSPNLIHSEDRLAAITDFIYNLGPTRYAASTLRKRVREEDWEAAAKELQKWVWGGGRKLPGLVARREEEARVLLNADQ